MTQGTGVRRDEDPLTATGSNTTTKTNSNSHSRQDLYDTLMAHARKTKNTDLMVLLAFHNDVSEKSLKQAGDLASRKKDVALSDLVTEIQHKLRFQEEIDTRSNKTTKTSDYDEFWVSDSNKQKGCNGSTLPTEHKKQANDTSHLKRAQLRAKNSTKISSKNGQSQSNSPSRKLPKYEQRPAKTASKTSSKYIQRQPSNPNDSFRYEYLSHEEKYAMFKTLWRWEQEHNTPSQFAVNQELDSDRLSMEVVQLEALMLDDTAFLAKLQQVAKQAEDEWCMRQQQLVNGEEEEEEEDDGEHYEGDADVLSDDNENEDEEEEIHVGKEETREEVDENKENDGEDEDAAVNDSKEEEHDGEDENEEEENNDNENQEEDENNDEDKEPVEEKWEMDKPEKDLLHTLGQKIDITAENLAECSDWLNTIAARIQRHASKVKNPALAERCSCIIAASFLHRPEGYIKDVQNFAVAFRDMSLQRLLHGYCEGHEIRKRAWEACHDYATDKEDDTFLFYFDKLCVGTSFSSMSLMWRMCRLRKDKQLQELIDYFKYELSQAENLDDNNLSREDEAEDDTEYRTRSSDRTQGASGRQHEILRAREDTRSRSRSRSSHCDINIRLNGDKSLAWRLMHYKLWRLAGKQGIRDLQSLLRDFPPTNLHFTDTVYVWAEGDAALTDWIASVEKESLDIQDAWELACEHLDSHNQTAECQGRGRNQDNGPCRSLRCQDLKERCQEMKEEEFSWSTLKMFALGLNSSSLSTLLEQYERDLTREGSESSRRTVTVNLTEDSTRSTQRAASQQTEQTTDRSQNDLFDLGEFRSHIQKHAENTGNTELAILILQQDHLPNFVHWDIFCGISNSIKEAAYSINDNELLKFVNDFIDSSRVLQKVKNFVEQSRNPAVKRSFSRMNVREDPVGSLAKLKKIEEESKAKTKRDGSFQQRVKRCKRGPTSIGQSTETQPVHIPAANTDLKYAIIHTQLKQLSQQPCFSRLADILRHHSALSNNYLQELCSLAIKNPAFNAAHQRLWKKTMFLDHVWTELTQEAMDRNDWDLLRVLDEEIRGRFSLHRVKRYARGKGCRDLQQAIEKYEEESRAYDFECLEEAQLTTGNGGMPSIPPQSKCLRLQASDETTEIGLYSPDFQLLMKTFHDQLEDYARFTHNRRLTLYVDLLTSPVSSLTLNVITDHIHMYCLAPTDTVLDKLLERTSTEIQATRLAWQSLLDYADQRDDPVLKGVCSEMDVRHYYYGLGWMQQIAGQLHDAGLKKLVKCETERVQQVTDQLNDVGQRQEENLAERGFVETAAERPDRTYLQMIHKFLRNITDEDDDEMHTVLTKYDARDRQFLNHLAPLAQLRPYLLHFMQQEDALIHSILYTLLSHAHTTNNTALATAVHQELDLKTFSLDTINQFARDSWDEYLEEVIITQEERLEGLCERTKAKKLQEKKRGVRNRPISIPATVKEEPENLHEQTEIHNASEATEKPASEIPGSVKTVASESEKTGSEDTGTSGSEEMETSGLEVSGTADSEEKGIDGSVETETSGSEETGTAGLEIMETGWEKPETVERGEGETDGIDTPSGGEVEISSVGEVEISSVGEVEISSVGEVEISSGGDGEISSGGEVVRTCGGDGEAASWEEGETSDWEEVDLSIREELDTASWGDGESDGWGEGEDGWSDGETNGGGQGEIGARIETVTSNGGGKESSVWGGSGITGIWGGAETRTGTSIWGGAGTIGIWGGTGTATRDDRSDGHLAEQVPDVEEDPKELRDALLRHADKHKDQFLKRLVITLREQKLSIVPRVKRFAEDTKNKDLLEKVGELSKKYPHCCRDRAEPRLIVTDKKRAEDQFIHRKLKLESSLVNMYVLNQPADPFLTLPPQSPESTPDRELFV